MTGGAHHRPGGGEDIESAVKTLLDDNSPGQGDYCEVPATRYLDCVTDGPCENDGAGGLVDGDAVQPGGEVDVGKLSTMQRHPATSHSLRVFFARI